MAELAEYGMLPLIVYTWAIPHADDWGRLTGDARQFKLLVCPALDVTAKDIDAALDQIAACGLWERYEACGRKCIAFPYAAWIKHQSYINAVKRGEDKSQFPAPPGFCLSDTAPNTETIAGELPQSPNNAAKQRKTAQNPASPTPRPSPSVRSNERTNGACAPASSSSDPFDPTEGTQRDPLVVEREQAIAANPHWEQALEAQTPADVRKRGKSLPYQAKIWRKWIADPGTAPPPPAPVRPLIDDPLNPPRPRDGGGDVRDRYGRRVAHDGIRTFTPAPGWPCAEDGMYHWLDAERAPVPWQDAYSRAPGTTATTNLPAGVMAA